MIDVILSFLGLTLLSPVCLILCVAAYVDDLSPVISEKDKNLMSYETYKRKLADQSRAVEIIAHNENTEHRHDSG